MQGQQAHRHPPQQLQKHPLQPGFVIIITTFVIIMMIMIIMIIVITMVIKVMMALVAARGCYCDV